MNILIIEDEILLANSIKELLKHKQFEVENGINTFLFSCLFRKHTLRSLFHYRDLLDS